jgi:hypothetical protein
VVSGVQGAQQATVVGGSGRKCTWSDLVHSRSGVIVSDGGGLADTRGADMSVGSRVGVISSIAVAVGSGV